MFRLLLWIALTLNARFVNAGNYRYFPEGFSLGVATAAYQIEGAWDEDGKGENMWDRLVHSNPSAIKNNDTGDIACDSYHKYKEDVALAAGLGVNHYRFSISWSRVLPTGFANQTNIKGISYYQDLVDEILSYNMTPVVTLYHWDLPQSLQDLGGWTNVDMVEYFVDYARVIFKYLRGVKYWATFNEPRLICRWGYGLGIFAPRLTLDGTGDYMCAYVIVKAHAAAYHMYKTEFPELTAKISLVMDGQWAEPATNSIPDKEAAERRNHFELGLYAHPIFNGNWPQVVIDRVGFRSENEGFPSSRLPEFTKEEIDYINGTHDYMGYNTYFTVLVSNIDEPEFGEHSYEKDMKLSESDDPSWNRGANDFPIVPWGIRKYLKWIKDTYGDPEIFVAENGVSDDGSTLEDDTRIHYYKEYLNAVLDAVYEDGVKVIAYTAWSLLDNFEWTDGYSQRFGLYSVDFNDPNRTRYAKKSVEYYRTIATTRRISATDVTTKSPTSDSITIDEATISAANKISFMGELFPLISVMCAYITYSVQYTRNSILS